MHEGAPQRVQPEDSHRSSLRGLLEAQQRKERDGSYAETVNSLFASWAGQLEQGHSREVTEQMKKLQPGLVSVLLSLEEQDSFAEALRHLKMNREILRLKIAIATVQGREDIAAVLEERMKRIDDELAGVADVLVNDN